MSPRPRKLAGSAAGRRARDPAPFAPRRRRPPMKLSEKLAALEQEESREADDSAGSAPAAASAKRSRPAKARTASTWDATKKKVRDLVMEEVAPKMQGLTADELAQEVKGALDRILQREDVQVTPLERRRFVQEMMSDTLGYGRSEEHTSELQSLMRISYAVFCLK